MIPIKPANRVLRVMILENGAVKDRHNRAQTIYSSLIILQRKV